MKKTLLLIFIIPFFALLIQGCSTAPSKPTLPNPPDNIPSSATVIPMEKEAAWHQHQTRLQELDYWHAEGRIAVKQGKKGGNASFVWTQRGDHFDIKLFGPFGSGAVYISGNDHHVQLKEANGKIRTAKTPEELLQAVAGWQVPITGLQYWLRGMPIPGEKLKKHRLGEGGTLIYLQQEGWHIDYESYRHDNALPLPAKMQLANRKLKVKIINKSWKAH